jgi:hypothetical protein
VAHVHARQVCRQRRSACTFAWGWGLGLEAALHLLGQGQGGVDVCAVIFFEQAQLGRINEGFAFLAKALAAQNCYVVVQLLDDALRLVQLLALLIELDREFLHQPIHATLHPRAQWIAHRKGGQISVKMHPSILQEIPQFS